MFLPSRLCVVHKNAIQHSRIHRIYFAIPRRGFGLIEGLVAIIVFSLGLVGVMHLMQVSTRSKQNFESYVQSATISNQAIERLMALGSMENTWSIEGFLRESQSTGSACSGISNLADLNACQKGVDSFKDFKQKLTDQGEINTIKKADGSTASNLKITFQHQQEPSNIASATSKSTSCNDPIYLQVEYTLQNLSKNASATSTTKVYQVPVYQYYTNTGASC